MLLFTQRFSHFLDVTPLTPLSRSNTVAKPVIYNDLWRQVVFVVLSHRFWEFVLRNLVQSMSNYNQNKHWTGIEHKNIGWCRSATAEVRIQLQFVGCPYECHSLFCSAASKGITAHAWTGRFPMLNALWLLVRLKGGFHVHLY
jgi:hypothetical protein